MRRWLRTFCEYPLDGFNMVIDLLVDDQNVVVPKIAFSGWWGKLDTVEFLPFVILPSGKVDFGGDEDTRNDDRFGDIELPKLSIERGRHFVYRDVDGEYEMVISRTTDLSTD